ncbi:MAG: MlaD family protein [Gammaproteobacteria bacterium]|nr:MlaD family protein [Gammaproteobacteria bacterium]
MESKTNYAIVGVVVLVLIAALIAAIIWLSVGFDQKKYDFYEVYMREAVSGLTPDAPVKFNGVKVGYVKGIRLNLKDPQQVELLLTISHEIPITTSTSATLISQGITGSTYIGLSASSPDLTPLRALPGFPYPIIPAKPSLFNQLDNALKGVSKNIDAVTIQIKRVFDKENSENIKETLKNLRIFTSNIEKDSTQFHEIILNINKSTLQWPQLTSQMTAGVTNFSEYTIPTANSLLKHLNRMAINLEKTSGDLKNNPSVLIRGTTPPKAGPGE